MFDVEDISQELLNRLFNSNVLPRIQLLRKDTFSTEFTDEEAAEIRRIAGSKATVVGVDIYQYSQFPVSKQMFVPHLFDLIYEHSWHLIRQNYSFLFQEYGEAVGRDRARCIDEREYFISTGDGGYQILQTPIHGVIFILTFATILRLYNADRFMRKLHAKIGNIEVRYAMTFDDVYRYRENYYGAGIINSARSLARDRINRFLIDGNVHDWFLGRTIGIEILMSWGIVDLKNIEEFADYDEEKIESGNNSLIPVKGDLMTREGFISIEVQKVGRVRQKETLLDVYNVHLQAVIHYKNLFEQEEIITVSVGNLNAVGIADD